jgi:hypothetical protein
MNSAANMRLPSTLQKVVAIRVVDGMLLAVGDGVSPGSVNSPARISPGWMAGVLNYPMARSRLAETALQAIDRGDAGTSRGNDRSAIPPAISK